MLSDNYNRIISYLRISVTERCNFRCVYCMPAEGIELANRDDLLSFEEIARVVRVGAKLGLVKIRLTGDLPNVFAASVVYDLPKYKNGNGFLKKLLNGWSVNGIVNAQSGVPVAVTRATNFNAFAGFGTQRPNLIRNPNLPGDRQTTAQWFDTSAFTIAPQFTIGNASRNPIRSPHYRNIDLGIIKRTNITETANVEFRTEIFNLTNTPPLGSPNTSFGSAAFSTITTAGDPRVVHFGLKLNF